MTSKKNGGYEASAYTQSTDDAGTTTTTERDVNVNVDSQGNIDKTVKAESSTDPKGLMNEKTNTAKTEIEDKLRGGYKQTTISKHTDAAGTDVTIKNITDVSVDRQGNVTMVVKSEKTIDPKGLFNEKTTTSMVKTVNGKIVDQKNSNS